MDAQVFNTLAAVQAEEDVAKRQALMDESAADLGAHFMRQPQDLEELAYDLLNVSWADAASTDLVRDIIEVKTVGLGDPDYIDEDLRGLRAYWQGKGGQIRSDILRYERAQMPREEIVAAIDLHQDEVATNFWGAFAKLTSQAQDKMRLLPAQRLVELIQASITASVNSDYYGTFAASTLTTAQVDSVLDAVAAKSTGRVTILGTPTGIRKIAHLGLDFGENIAEQIFRTGSIGVYKGFNVAQVENFEDFAGNFVLPDDELWLVGNNAGRLTYYGSQAKVQQLRLPSFYLRWETARDAGMLLFGASRGRIGRIKLT